MAGPGLVLATADKLQSSAGAENPDAFDFANSDAWGAITIALRQTSTTQKTFGRGNDTNEKNRIVAPIVTIQDGAILDNLIIEGDVIDADGEDMDNVLITGDLEIQTAGTYNFSDVIVMGDVTNSDAAGNVTINLSGSSALTTSEPGTGNGEVNILNTVTISVHVTDRDDTDIENARVLITAAESAGTITSGDTILTGLTNSSGIIQDTAFNYETAFGSGLDIDVRTRQSSVSPYMKTDERTGTITQAGYSATIAMLSDE